MIYESTILKYKENELKNILNPMKLVQEYYENEISLLTSIKEANEDYIVEGVITNIKNKIVELIQRFIKWIRDIFNKVKDRFFGKDKDSLENRIDKNKKDLNNANDVKKIELIAQKSSVKMEKVVNESDIMNEADDAKYVIYRYDTKELYNEKEMKHAFNAIDFKDCKDQIKEIEDNIRILKTTGLSYELSYHDRNNLQDFIDEGKDEIDELINRINDISDLRAKKYIKKYEYNNYKELSNALAKFIEEDKHAVDKLYNYIRRIRYNIKVIDNGFEKIQKDIKSLPDNIKNSKDLELLSSATNISISYTKHLAQYLIKVASIARSALMSQCK